VLIKVLIKVQKGHKKEGVYTTYPSTKGLVDIQSNKGIVNAINTERVNSLDPRNVLYVSHLSLNGTFLYSPVNTGYAGTVSYIQANKCVLCVAVR